MAVFHIEIFANGMPGILGIKTDLQSIEMMINS